MQNILRNRNPPLVLMNSYDDTILPQEIQKLYATPNSRRRRSNAFHGRNDGTKLNGEFSTDKPWDLSKLTQNQMLQQN